MAGGATQAGARRGPRGWSRRRWRRALRVGCLPAAAIGGLVVTGLVNAVILTPPPPWAYYDPRSYTLGSMLGASLGTLAVLQMLATWLMGLLAAVAAGRAVSGQGARLRPRLRAVRRRMRSAAWAALALRLMLLAAMLVGGALILTRWLGEPITVEGATQFRRAFEARPLLIVLPGAVALAQMLAGPFLRMRASAALGVLGATLAAQRERRAWAAASARLGAGLALALGLIWGAAGGVLLMLVSYDPFYSARYSALPQVFPLLPDYLARVLVASLVVGGLAAINLAGQIALPPLYVRMADSRWRMADGGDGAGFGV